MTRVVDRLLRVLQHLIARVSRSLHVRKPPGRPVSWVVGPTEVASLVASVAGVIPDSFSAVLTPHRFFDVAYDLRIDPGPGDWLRRRFLAPWVFGRLAAVATGFFYVGADGFLLSEDDRRWEFAFLRRHGVRIVCLFAGSDIRSPARMRTLQQETGIENIVTYLDEVSPVFATPAYDDQRRRTAAIADEFADVVFTAAVDQLSYLEKPTEAFPYLFPDEDLLPDSGKHAAPGPRIVVHAPSSPIIKGTQVVRAAVARLRGEGYDFEYRELIGVPHTEVLAALRDAHIVLNEFYAFVPGVFGVEAMASNCALLTSADEAIETDLPPGSNAAWIVTRAADVQENLRRLLDRPDLIAPQAAAGLEWVLAHATRSAAGARLRETLARASR